MAMRAAARSYRGHLYLWLWGSIWILCSLLNWRGDARLWNASLWLLGIGILASFLIGFIQGRHVRSRIDKRFLAVCVAILAFGYVAWPVVLGPPHSYESSFGLGALVWMQLYVVAGIWFDNYLVWVGVLVTLVILAGLLFLPGLFWGCSLLGGVSMLGTGFYVRYCWR